jgi:hypothetical protein
MSRLLVVSIVAVWLIIPRIGLSNTYYSILDGEKRVFETLHKFPTYMECFDVALEVMTHLLKEQFLQGYPYVKTHIERQSPSVTLFHR